MVLPFRLGIAFAIRSGRLLGARCARNSRTPRTKLPRWARRCRRSLKCPDSGPRRLRTTPISSRGRTSRWDAFPRLTINYHLPTTNFSPRNLSCGETATSSRGRTRLSRSIAVSSRPIRLIRTTRWCRFALMGRFRTFRSLMSRMPIAGWTSWCMTPTHGCGSRATGIPILPIRSLPRRRARQTML